MNILIAPDKFKGTLSSLEVCAIVEDELRRNLLQRHNIKSFPLADGGDGTTDVLRYHLGGRVEELMVHDPLMRPVQSSYLITADGKTAFIEMARASGLVLLKPLEQNPLHTTTYGTGELIRDALTKGATHICLGIGGSATNDGGTGALAALGVRFLNKDGSAFIPTGGTLEQIAEIDLSALSGRLKDAKIIALCDVTNPFTGTQGAAQVYAPQKGADKETVQQLEKGMEHFARLTRGRTGLDLNQVPGSGAGGGIAGGLHAWLNAEIKSGVQSIMELTRFEDALQWADLVITGEGKVDEQTLSGKLVMGVVRKAQQFGKKLLIICGRNELEKPFENDKNVLSVFDLIKFSGGKKAVRKPKEELRKLIKERVVSYIERLPVR